MGDPRNIHGLSYNVGSCATQGVSIFQLQNRLVFTDECLLTLIYLTSSIPARLASIAPAHPRSSRTVMPRTHTAATETTLPLTKATARSTASKPSLSSTASSHHKLCDLWEHITSVMQWVVGFGRRGLRIAEEHGCHVQSNISKYLVNSSIRHSSAIIKVYSSRWYTEGSGYSGNSRYSKTVDGFYQRYKNSICLRDFAMYST